MNKTIIVFLLVLMLPIPAEAQMLERQAARLIRKSGHWCDRITDMRYDQQASAKGPRVVRVTCDDGTRYVQYNLTLGSDDKVRKIEQVGN